MINSDYKSAPTPANNADRKAALLLFGLGYTGAAIAALAAEAGWRVIATSRAPDRLRPPRGVELIPFEAASSHLSGVTHVLETAPPGEDGDPALARHGTALAEATALRWAGLLSTTGVYGDRGGAWVDEHTEPAPTGPRGARRLHAEREWATAFARAAVDLFRVAGIYGPGRSPFAEIIAGRARRVDKPGHRFGRIHRDDIARAVLAAMTQDRAPGARALNLTDDEPVESAEATAEAARPARPAAAANGPVRTGVADDVAYGAQLLGREPPGRQPRHAGRPRDHMALSQLPGGATRHPRAGARGGLVGVAPGPKDARAGGRRP